MKEIENGRKKLQKRNEKENYDLTLKNGGFEVQKPEASGLSLRMVERKGKKVCNKELRVGQLTIILIFSFRPSSLFYLYFPPLLPILHHLLILLFYIPSLFFYFHIFFF